MESFDKAKLCGSLAQEKKAKDIVIMNLQGLTDIADYFVIASGTSERHVKTIADSIEAGMKDHGLKPFSLEGHSDARWVIIDYQSVVAHIFLDQLRELYDLESLWIEAEKYRIQNEKQSAGVENEKKGT
ncbi:MAG TPA: ribosome silencing factor [Syntrophorhabdaceae bacterium]|nr:ribosome silencing factor [Syntrophorhabdaceae bacterium]